MLREHRNRQHEQRAAADHWEDRDLVITTRAGRPINQRNMQRVWRRIIERAGVEHRGIHHLRHTFGTTLAERGVHERVAQQLLGHADSRTTREIYTHVSERTMGEAVQAITDAVSDVVDSATRVINAVLLRPDQNGSRNGSRPRSVDQRDLPDHGPDLQT